MTKVKSKKPVPRSKPKTKLKSKQSNIGLRAALVAPAKLNRKTLLIVVLLVAAIGGFVIYRSEAATGFVGFSRVDENDQVNRVNQTRAANGLSKLYNAVCLSGANEAWAKHLSDTYINTPTTGIPTGLDMPPAQALAACGNPLPWSAAINNFWGAGYFCVIPGKPNTTAYSPITDTCSHTAFDTLMASPPHRANILDARALYVGAGSYRDSKGRMWVSQSFFGCNCLLATQPTGEWRLSAKATVSSPLSNRGPSANVHRGQTVVFYHDMINTAPSNNIPSTATYPRYVVGLHLSSSGKVLFSNTRDLATGVTAVGGVSAWTDTLDVPTNATIGDRYCHVIHFSYTNGAGTADSKSAAACATVE